MALLKKFARVNTDGIISREIGSLSKGVKGDYCPSIFDVSGSYFSAFGAGAAALLTSACFIACIKP